MQKINIDNFKFLTLKKSELFKNLNAESLRKICNITHLKDFNKNQFICFEKEPIDAIYIVARGKIKVFAYSENTNQTYIIKIANAGAAIGEVAFLLENPIFPTNAQALDKSTIAIINRLDFLNLLKTDAELSFYLLAQFAKIIFDFTKQIRQLALFSIKERLMHFFIEKSKNLKSLEFELDITKQTLAELMGTIPETLSRTLKQLEKEKIIKMTQRKIKILKIPEKSNIPNEISKSEDNDI